MAFVFPLIGGLVGFLLGPAVLVILYLIFLAEDYPRFVNDIKRKQRERT